MTIILCIAGAIGAYIIGYNLGNQKAMWWFKDEIIASNRRLDQSLRNIYLPTIYELTKENKELKQKPPEMPVNVFRHVDNKELAEKLGAIAYLLDNNKIEYESGGIIFGGTKDEGYIGINGDIKLKFIKDK